MTMWQRSVPTQEKRSMAAISPSACPLAVKTADSNRRTTRMRTSMLRLRPLPQLIAASTRRLDRLRARRTVSSSKMEEAQVTFSCVLEPFGRI